MISDIKITDLTPVIKDPSLTHLIPKTLFPKHVTFVISEASNAVANGIRRTLANELLTSVMWFEYEHFTSNNPFSINSMILNRFRLIPIDQKTPIDAVFELDVQNKSDKEAYVYTSQIKIINPGSKNGTPLKKLPFNETFPLFTLLPGKWLRITKITMYRGFGYKFAGHSLSSNCVCLPLDQKPINLYLPPDSDRGIPSRLSNPRKYSIEFNTTGAMDPAAMMVAVCDNIIARVQNLLYSIEASNNIYIINIDGESHTIGNLLMRTITDLYEIMAVTYNVDSVARKVTLRIRCDEDINTLMTSVIKHIVRQYTDIKKAFE